MPLDRHIAAPFDSHQLPIPPILLPPETAASSSPSPLIFSFQTGMEDDLISMYHNRLLSLFQPTTASAPPSSSYSSTAAAAVHPKLEEDCGSPFLLPQPGADFRDYLPQQPMQGLPPQPQPQPLPQHHHHISSFRADLELHEPTPHVLDEMIFQRHDGESTTGTTTRASSVSMVGYDYEDDPEEPCRSTAALHGDSSSFLAALGALQHERQPSTMLHDSVIVAGADSLYGVDAAAFGFICGGDHSARPMPFTSEEGAMDADGGYTMMDHPFPPLAPEFWTVGADNNCNVVAFGKRSRHQRGQTAEKQRRVQISQKFLALRALLPNSTKTDKSTIIKDATDYITELLRHVQKLKLLVQRKHLSTLEETNAGATQTGMLRSSFVQRSSNRTCIDVRVLEDEVNIKLCQRHPSSCCLLLVARGLLEMQLELIHLTSANIGNSLIIWVNAKIQVGSSVHATFIANKLVDAVNGNLYRVLS